MASAAVAAAVAVIAAPWGDGALLSILAEEEGAEEGEEEEGVKEDEEGEESAPVLAPAGCQDEEWGERLLAFMGGAAGPGDVVSPLLIVVRVVWCRRSWWDRREGWQEEGEGAGEEKEMALEEPDCSGHSILDEGEEELLITCRRCWSC